MGIEPTRPAWKAGVLPLNYTRRYLDPPLLFRKSSPASIRDPAAAGHARCSVSYDSIRRPGCQVKIRIFPLFFSPFRLHSAPSSIPIPSHSVPLSVPPPSPSPCRSSSSPPAGTPRAVPLTEGGRNRGAGESRREQERTGENRRTREQGNRGTDE